MSKYGHRESHDLDFSRVKEFSFSRLAVKAARHFPFERSEQRTDTVDIFTDSCPESSSIY